MADRGAASVADPREAIRARARALGFAAVGFTPAALGPEAGERLRAFVAAGGHGTMGWMAERMAERSQPRVLWPAARSAICVGLSYAPEGDPLADLAHPDRGHVSVYARGRDYHDVLKGLLKHLAQFVAARFGAEVKVFSDTAPVMEKPLAQAAGLGWQGKHTNLVSRSHGAWLFLGEVFTTLDLALDLAPDPPHPDRCGSCTRCLAACPTDAFPAPYRLDATRCIAYLTIEHDGPIPEALRPAMGNRVFGCDDCLAVCPWNRFARASAAHPKLAADPARAAPELAALAALDEAGFRARFAGTPIRRSGRRRIVRNALVAIGNSGQPALRPVAAARCGDADPVVAEAAAWAVSRLPAA